MTTKTTYTAICERVDSWWEITVPELASGGVTQARSLDDVAAMVKDLVVAMTGVDPESVEVDVQAPAVTDSHAHSRAGKALAYVGSVGAVGAISAILHRIMSDR